MVRHSVYLILSVLMLSGCGLSAAQKQDLAQFGTATEAMGSLAEDQLVQVRSDVIRMNTANYILDSRHAYTRPQFDQPTSLESITKRVAAAKALKSYGTLLNQLATADHSEGLKKAASEVIANFNTALGTGLTSAERDATSGIIMTVGKLMIEKKKKDAVRQIVLAYHEKADTMADLLAGDLTVDERRTEGQWGVMDGYFFVAGRLENTSIGALASTNYNEREAAVNAYILAESARLKAKEVSSQTAKANSGFKKANAALVAAMKTDTYTSTDINAYANSVLDLANMVKVLSNK
jgi:hypothetical protein